MILYVRHFLVCGLSIFFLYGCSTQYTHENYTPIKVNDFKKAWGTFYYTPEYEIDEKSKLMPLDRDNVPFKVASGIQIKLKKKELCEAFMEGAFIIKHRSKKYSFTFDSLKKHYTNCSQSHQFPHLGQVRFKKSTSHWGKGVMKYSLVPYRTIAVDPKFIPYGTVIYIPSAVGTIIKIGKQAIEHDGVFFAGDTGVSIKGNHIDFYIGKDRKSSFKFFSSSKNKIFKFHIVNDTEIVQSLHRIHMKNYD